MRVYQQRKEVLAVVQVDVEHAEAADHALAALSQLP
jgi:hypothetical protein